MAKKSKQDSSVITFADEAKRIEKRYKDKIDDPISKQAYLLEMEKLKARNEMAKAMYENTEKMKMAVQNNNGKVLAKGVMAKGGMLPKYYLGNFLNLEGVPTKTFLTDSENNPPFSGGPTLDKQNPANVLPDLTKMFSNLNFKNEGPLLSKQNQLPDLTNMFDSLNSGAKQKVIDEITSSERVRKFQEDIDTGKKSNTPFNFNNLAIGLKSAQLINSFKNAITPTVQETPILPDFSKSDDAFGRMSYDNTEAINQITRANNTQRSQIEDNTMSDSVRQARLAGNNINLMNSIGNTMLSSQQMKNALLAQKGSYETQKAGTIANSLYQNRIDNLQNQAAKKLAGEQFVQNLSQVGTEANKYQMFRDMLENQKEIQTLTNTQGFSFLNLLSPNFKLSPEYEKAMEEYTANKTPENMQKVKNAMLNALITAKR